MTRWNLDSTLTSAAEGLESKAELAIEPLTLQERYEFFLQFSTLFQAGCPLLACLSAIQASQKRPNQSRVAGAMMVDIERGRSISESMLRQAPSFSDEEIGLVKLGETSGRLHYVLEQVCRSLELRSQTRSRMIQASIYPLAVALFAALVVGFMAFVLLPQVGPIFRSFQVPLPFFTRLVLKLSDFATWGFLILLGCIFASLLIFRENRRWWKLLDSLPVIKDLLRLRALAESAMALSILVGSGASLDAAFKLMAESTTSSTLGESFARMRGAIRAGASFQEALEREESVLPSVYRQLLVSGAETGRIEYFAKQLSALFHNEFQWHLDQRLKLLEPILLLTLGGGVGLLLLSCFLPFYNLVSLTL